MESIGIIYESDVPSGAVVKRPKFCENCGTNFYRPVGSADILCRRCHALADMQVAQPCRRRGNVTHTLRLPH
jgi:protein-arginine kinase activator protein McsA